MKHQKHQNPLKRNLAWLCAVMMMVSCLGTLEVAARPKLQSLAGKGENLIINGDFEDEDEIKRQLAGDPIDVPQTWSLVNAAVTTAAASSGKYGLELRPKSNETAMAVFDFIHFALAPNSTYKITADIKSDGKMKPDVDFVPNANGSGEIVSSSRGTVGTSTSWQKGVTLMTLTTGVDYVYGSLKLSIYKGEAGVCCLDNVTIIANGNEWCPTPSGWVTLPTDANGNLYSKENPFYDDFDGETLDVNKWLVSNTGWGGDNGGLAAANVSLVTEDGRSCVRLESHGEQYEGNVKGTGGVTHRVGAGIVTRPYFASGEYEVVAKIQNTLGVCRAFWSFSYIGYMPGDPEFYWDDQSTPTSLRGNIRNTEIDWEFPTAYNDNRKDDAISLNILRTNCWGGKRPGEGGEFTRRANPENNATVCIADGQFHTFTYVWCSVDDSEDPYKSNAYLTKAAKESKKGVDKHTGRSSVTWYVDGIMVNSYDMNDSEKWNAGQDVDTSYPAGKSQLGKFYENGGYGINTPYRAARFWIADWFPVNSNKGLLFPAGSNAYTGWAGTPDFDTCYTYIDSCTIKPYYQKVTDPTQKALGLPGDEYNYREDVPNKDFVTPIEYPGWQKAHGLLERPIPKTVIDGSNVTVTWDAIDNATGYDLKIDGKVNKSVTSPYKITGLAVGQHTLQLRAKNAQETGAWSYDAMVCIGVPKIKAHAEGHRIVVEWDDVPGAVDYQMEVDNGGLMNTLTGSFYSMKSGDTTSPYLQGFANGTHTVRVRTVGARGTSNWSQLVQVKIDSDGLPIPGIVAKQNDSNPNKWQLIVDEGTGEGSVGTMAKYYEIQDRDGKITQINSRRNGGQYPIIDVTLGNGVYTYSIRAVDDKGRYSDWSAPISVSNGYANDFAAPGMHVSSGAGSVDIWWDYSNQTLGHPVTFDLEEDGKIVLSNYAGTISEKTGQLEFVYNKTGFAVNSTHKYRIRANITDIDYTTEWSPVTTVVCGSGGGDNPDPGGQGSSNNSGTILNGTFDEGTTYWNLDNAVLNGDGTVTLTPSEINTATLTQVVGGCKPSTTYTVAGDFTLNNVHAYLYIRGATTQELSVDLSKQKQFTFTTGTNVSEITFIVSVWKQQTGTVICDNLSLSEGSTVTSYTTQATVTTQTTPPTKTTGTPSTPTSGSPSTPTSGSPSTPTSGSPSTPTSESPSTPTSGSPSTPTSESPSTPTSGDPSTPKSGDPSDPTETGITPTSGNPSDPTETGVPTTQPSATEPGAAYYGDANGDGAVNMKDVLAMRKYIAGLESKVDVTAADVNGDGAVNMKDVLHVRKFLANLIDHLGK